MVDRFRSEDDDIEDDPDRSNSEWEQPADDPDLSGEPAASRPISEPPPPDRSNHPPSSQPAAVNEWLGEWEDVRPDGAAPDVSTTGGSETIIDTDQAESGPPARIPSPPPVRSEPAPATRSGSIRASRPRPVSGSDEAATILVGTDGSGRSGATGTESVVTIVEAVNGQARRTTTRTVRIGGLDVTVDATQRAMLVTAAVGMVVVAGLFAYLLSGLGSQTEAATRQADLQTVADRVGPDLNVSASSPTAPSISELALSTVRIAGLDDTGQAVCAGSGVLVGEEGVILTNAHVITIDDDCPFTTIAVGVTLDTSDEPELRYRGEVLVVDEVLDLAVVKIVGALDSDDPLEIGPNFPVAVLGDSDQVDLGDSIRILGYPVIGGETITHTTGTVAGFVEEDGRSRALMKTDASISAGNSGGMAVNEVGEVVGIPTRAGANEAGLPVDCRAVSDTNDDGRVDSDDACVSIGGFLNSIRPINLARDLLSRAEATLQDAGSAPVDADSFDLSEISFWNPRFSTGEEDDGPVDEVITLQQGAEEICLFVDWSGMPNGVPWAAIWSKDGTKINEFSIFKIWEYGESGRNFWYCAEDRRGHPAGVYEVGLFLNNELAFVEAIEVTEEPVEIFEVTWVNKSDEDICGLAVNPLAFSRHAGVNVLEPGTTIRPGDSAVIDLPAGDIVVEAYDCMGMAIAAELEGLAIPQDLFVDGEQVPFVIGGSTEGDAPPGGDG